MDNGRLGCLAQTFLLTAFLAVMAFAMLRVSEPEYQGEVTARYIAMQENRTAREVAWQQTLQVNGPWFAMGVVLIVAAVQAGRTFRHRDTMQAETKRILLAYVAQHYLPGERVRIEQRSGTLAIVDYERREVIPAGVIEAQWHQLTGPTE